MWTVYGCLNLPFVMVQKERQSRESLILASVWRKASFWVKKSTLLIINTSNMELVCYRNKLMWPFWSLWSLVSCILQLRRLQLACLSMQNWLIGMNISDPLWSLYYFFAFLRINIVPRVYLFVRIFYKILASEDWYNFIPNEPC